MDDMFNLPSRRSGGKREQRLEVKVRGRYMARYRYVMELHLGRKLTQDEVVHHINGDTMDDRIENLQLMTNAEHVRLHNILRQSHLPITGIAGENHPNWMGDEASDHAKYMRIWIRKKKEQRRSVRS